MPGRNHPVFAPLYNALTWAGEHTTLGGWRTQALAPAFGRLLIIGLGPGYDLAHVPPAVTEIVAIEPAAAMRNIARRKLQGRRLNLVAGIGEQLPLLDASVDSVLCALVLCSVDDPVAVLREIRRVLRPGGVLCVLEHVRAADGTHLGRLQDRAAPTWAAIAGGCQPHRRTRAALEAAGFDTSELADRTLWLNVPLLVPTLVGHARPHAG
jgi:ubiquinone/menaquinone biosynthesis C-methylase UbiE